MTKYYYLLFFTFIVTYSCTLEGGKGQTNQIEQDSLHIASLVGKANKPLFDGWDDDMFAQVLAVYWKPWGITKDKIISLGNSPISYLENNDTYTLVEPDSITLPN